MPRNVEIKARLAASGRGSLDAVRPLAAALAAGPAERLDQDDTFFACRDGRLKLRVFGGGAVAELIAYRRADAEGPKTSDYRIAPVADADALRATLAHALGATGRVVKQRTLYLVGRTRVHLDRVEGLGDFLELEVVLADDEPDAAGETEAATLLGRLGIDPRQRVRGAYVDLLAAAIIDR